MSVEQIYKEIFLSGPDALLLVDKEGVIRMLNERVTDLLGYTEEQLIGNKVESLIPENLRKGHHVHRHDYNKNPRVREMGRDMLLPCIKADGKQIFVEISLSPLNTQSGWVMAGIRDVSDKLRIKDLQEQVDRLLQVNQIWEEYIYITSHDLQEPLQNISSLSNLLKDLEIYETDDKVKQIIDYLLHSSDTMSHRIKDLLLYARIGQKRKSNLCNVDELIEEVLKDIHSQIVESNAQIEIGNMPTMKLFKTEFCILIENLITNAIKYSKENYKPIVSIEADDLESYWLFKVSDNGIGIADKNKEKVFKLFQRVSYAKGNKKGSGIGLAHCQKIVHLHGGKIWLKSNLGEGSTFYFTISKQLDSEYHNQISH